MTSQGSDSPKENKRETHTAGRFVKRPYDLTYQKE